MAEAANLGSISDRITVRNVQRNVQEMAISTSRTSVGLAEARDHISIAAIDAVKMYTIHMDGQKIGCARARSNGKDRSKKKGTTRNEQSQNSEVTA